MDKNSKIYVAGHNGLVGTSIVKSLRLKGYNNIIFRDLSELDLRNQDAVRAFFDKQKPDIVVNAAARVGGIYANNKYRAEFIYDNLMIQNNIIDSAYRSGVKKLLFLGSTCIYPREAPQPIKEDYLLTSPLEYTNEPYAIAKIAGIKVCESYNIQYGTNFISVMPTNLYGPGDNFNLLNSHVLPALLRKIHLARCIETGDMEALVTDLAKRPIPELSSEMTGPEIIDALGDYGIKGKKDHAEVEIWGTGSPMREFLWIEDMVDACIYLLENVDFTDIISARGLKDEIRNTHINIGTGTDISIKELAGLVKDIIGFSGKLCFNADKPDGTPRKLTDVSLLNKLGWKHKTSLEEGIKKLYSWYTT
ncbi:MAG: GDP-L-fucose synthase [Marinilabiliaceae bacterium]|jgi:GDP-L-fucose synthase|nr:GDP-L-fucose synthase [Marinilabiliaceae bacterium]